jgi:uncharacterized membrane protein
VGSMFLILCLLGVLLISGFLLKKMMSFFIYLSMPFALKIKKYIKKDIYLQNVLKKAPTNALLKPH